MSGLLTREEYASIAADLTFPVAPFIDGKFRVGRGEKFPTINPATGKPVATITGANTKDVDLAVEKAREAFDQGRWSKMHPSERKDILIKLCKLITRNKRELAVMESLDSGKTIKDCMIVREPVGVVAAVLPWNFPLLMMAWKIGPALAAGNSVIVKPAEQTSLTALRLAELAMEAGLPRGVLQVLPGMGAEAGEPLGRHMDVDMLSFTGSTETGRLFLKYSAESNLKKVVLECGGSANSRLIVHEAVKAPLLERILARTRDWRTGDPLDPSNHLGALVDKEHCKKVAKYLKEPKGTQTLLGGKAKGNFVEPTIFDGVKSGDKLAKDEIFGPILSIITVSSFDEAIQVANDTQYGLAASVFTANGKKAIRAAREIKAGTVSVNCYGEGDISTPFGGYKQSGFGGRDNGIHAHDQYTELKTIWIDLSDNAPDESVG